MSLLSIRRLSLMLLPLSLAACGGGESATAPVENGTAGDTALPVDEPVYDADNLTAIDAAASNASNQPLAPDVAAEGSAENLAVSNESAPK